MAKTFYLGTLASGAIVSRASTRNDFTHAADRPDGKGNRLPSFGTSAGGAARNFYTNHADTTPCEVVPVRIVTAAEYKAARKLDADLSAAAA